MSWAKDGYGGAKMFSVREIEGGFYCLNLISESDYNLWPFHNELQELVLSMCRSIEMQEQVVTRTVSLLGNRPQVFQLHPMLQVATVWDCG